MSRIPDQKIPVQHTHISAEQSDRRIDNYLFGLLKQIPKTRIYQMLRRGEVRVNSRRVRQNYRLQEGDEVRIPPVSLENTGTDDSPRPYLLERLNDTILYEDQNFLAINKPAGLVVHAGSGRSFGVIELLRHLRPEGEELQLAHRLDSDTSGILLVTKDHRFLRQLQTCFRDGSISKHYTALLKGKLARQQVIVDKPLQRNLRRAGQRLSGIDQAGKSSHTAFTLNRALENASLVDVRIKTGRTHQIRVHAASIDCPIAGDEKYGDKVFNKSLKAAGLTRMFLHASSIHLPATLIKSGLMIKAPLSAELQAFLERYEKGNNRTR